MRFELSEGPAMGLPLWKEWDRVPALVGRSVGYAF